MKTIYFSVPGSTSGGGPSIFVYKTAQALAQLGYGIIYDKPQRADAAICIIETGKTLRKIDRKRTRIILRCDGIYNDEYNKLFNRAIRPDMTALHSKLTSDIPAVDHVVFQSQWSKDCIESEIVKRVGPYSIIHNGVNTNLFKPVVRQPDGFINLFHIGKIRNGYIMNCLIGAYKELQTRGVNVRLLIAGSMDAECSQVYATHKSDTNIKLLGSFQNNKASDAFRQGDIYLAPRQGSSSDNVIPEALASGLPVVAPSWGGNAEMLQDGQDGIVVKTGHWTYDQNYINGIADAVQKIIPDIGGFKSRARKSAEQNHTIEKMVQKYIKAMGI